MPNSALYPFGHGLTYGKIEYGGLVLGAPAMPMNGSITVAARVTNRAAERPRKSRSSTFTTARRASPSRSEAQRFPQDRSRARPVRSGRVHASRGGLSFLGAGDRPTVEPGTFDVWIAPSAESDGVNGSFELTA